jgi:hypothetical protein
MIVRSVRGLTQLITQPAHADLAGTIMEHCLPLAARPRREAILLAIAQHDNGWAEEDAAPVIDRKTGEVVDFVNAPASVRHTVWPRGVQRLAEEPWAAALVAQHALTLHDRFRPEPEWLSFFAKMEAARASMLRRTGLRLEDLVADYAFVRLADLISLAFCTRWTDEQRFETWAVQLVGARVVVSPDVFGRAEIPIQIEAKELRKGRFESDLELRNALREAHTTTLRGEVAGSIS